MTMMSGKGMEFMKSYMGALVRMNETGTEYVRGIPVVKVFQQTVYSFKAFHDAIADYARMAQDYAGTFCRKPQVLQLSVLNGLVVFLLPVAFILAPGEADFASFVADFAFYAIFSAVIPTAMAKLMFMSEASQMAGDSLGRVRAILEAKPLEVPANPRPIEGGDVRFEHVSFAYEGAEANALDDVSFEVPAGATLALVGPSGGGKSTCASLIPRFWDATAGRVLVGGVDVRDADPHELMDKIAFVFQTNQLFSRTLEENVRAARPDATREQVLAALRAAQCDDIVAKLPQGLDTRLGAGGAYLSGGEVQRVALARADHQGRAHRGARRGHGVRRFRERGPHPARVRKARRARTVIMSCPPALDGGGRRPDRGARPGPRGRARHACRAGGSRRAVRLHVG